MKTARTLVAFLIGLVALLDRPAPGCPLARTPLWDLIQTAELIAFVRVEKLEPEQNRSPVAAPVSSDEDSDDFDRNVAILKVLDTWKGPFLGAIRLNYSGDLSVGGRRVVVGDEIVVFLESGETQVRRAREAEQTVEQEVAASSADAEPIPPEQLLADRDYVRRWEESRTGRWFVAGYGVDLLAAESADTYPLRELVSEAVQLQAGNPVPDETKRAWLVEAAGLRAAREVAILDLQQIIQRSESDESAPAKARLSQGELRTIADGFVRNPSADSSVPALLEFLSGYEDGEFDRAVISVIEAGVAAPRIPWWIPEAIRHLIVRSGWHDWGAGIWERHRAEGDLKEIWPAVAKDLQLPSVPPASLRIDGAEAEQVSD